MARQLDALVNIHPAAPLHLAPHAENCCTWNETKVARQWSRPLQHDVCGRVSERSRRTGALWHSACVGVTA